jgi:hypothetical protein
MPAVRSALTPPTADVESLKAEFVGDPLPLRRLLLSRRSAQGQVREASLVPAL